MLNYLHIIFSYYICIFFVAGLDAPNSFSVFWGDGFQNFTAQFRFAPKGIAMSATVRQL